MFLANANLNGLAICNNQSRTSSEHFDPPLFQNPYKIMAEAESNHELYIRWKNSVDPFRLRSASTAKVSATRQKTVDQNRNV